MDHTQRLYLLRFFTPTWLGSVPVAERANSIRSYFNNCMGQIQPFLDGIEVFSQQEYLLSAAIRVPHDRFDRLKGHLDKTHLGELVSEDAFTVVGAADRCLF
jgi:hypothetical protein